MDKILPAMRNFPPLCSAVFFAVTGMLFSFSNTAQAAARIELYTDSCTVGTDYFEFRLFATNNSTAGETLYLSSGTIRLTHSTAIVPSGTNTYDFIYQNGTCDPLLAPLYSSLGVTYNLNYNSSTRNMQIAYSTGTLGNAYATLNAPIPAGQTICLGAFRLTITSAPWADNQPVGFSWNGTSSGITAFEDTASVVTNMNTTANRTLGSMCSLTTPSTTWISSLNQGEDLRLYPSPSNSYLFVEGIIAGTTVHLFSFEGQRELTLQSEGGKLVIPVIGLSKGIHFLEAGIIRLKFVVQ
jgi:hypothetical protein